MKQAENEIAEVFDRTPKALELDTDTGFFGDLVGKCPVCGKDVIRGKYGYGCMGYKDGCNFRIGLTICKKTVPKSEISRLLATGSTAKLSGFISKNGKSFSGKLVLKENNVVFSFD